MQENKLTDVEIAAKSEVLAKYMGYEVWEKVRGGKKI